MTGPDWSSVVGDVFNRGFMPGSGLPGGEESNFDQLLSLTSALYTQYTVGNLSFDTPSTNVATTLGS
jgi:hypothetical protein